MLKKRIVFEEWDKNHADLILKLRSKGITQKVFFQSVLRAFIDDNQSLEGFFDNLIRDKSRFGKKTQGKIHAATRKGREAKYNFGLTEEEKSDIFDILEKEGLDI